jgi:hypothetical protein
MPLTRDSELVAFDAEAALAAAQAAAGDGGVLSFVEFTADEFRTLFVTDEVLSMYRDEDHLQEHYDQVLSHLNMDFLERDAYEQTLLPNAGRVRSIVTQMDEMTLLRVLYGDRGLYIALAPAAPIVAVTDAVEAEMAPEDPD